MSRLPTSLHWLIEKRGRIDGSIQKTERYLNKNRRAYEQFQELTNELVLLRETLASIDRTLQLHKLQVDPQNIPTINGRNQITDLPRGELTQLIYERIEIGNGQPVSSIEIVDFILEHLRTSGRPPMVRVFLARKVGRRIETLARAGTLVRHHPRKTNHCGWWTLQSSLTQDIQMANDALDRNL